MTGQLDLAYPVSGGSMAEGNGGDADNVRPQLAEDEAAARGEDVPVRGQTAQRAEQARRDQERLLDRALNSLTPGSEEQAAYESQLQEAINDFRARENREPNPQERRTLQTQALLPRILELAQTSAIPGLPGQGLFADKEEEEEYRRSLRPPRSLNEIMDSVARNDPDFNRDFPLLKENGEVNDANFLRWIRKRIMILEDEEGSDTQINYFSQVTVPFGNSEISVYSMVLRQDRFFRDKGEEGKLGKVHTGLAEQIRKELFSRKIARDRDVIYRTGGKGMGDDSNLPGQMAAIFKDNNFTKNLWGGKSLWYWTTEMPLDFEEEKAEENKQDSKLGRSIATSLMVYYHLSDYEKLKEMLGKESSLFKREYFLEARERLAKEDEKTNPHKNLEELEKDFISNTRLDEIFAEGDHNPDSTELIKFLTHIFTNAQPDPRHERMVREMVRIAIREKYNLKTATGEEDTGMTQYAERHAWSMVRWTGAAARNDLGAAAFDAQSKILNSQQYRNKQADPNRGGAFGNMYNIGLYKAFGLDYLDAMYTAEKGPDGRPLLLREVLENIARVGINDEKMAVDESADFELEARQAASYLSFPNASELNYTNNGTNRWFGAYELFLSGKELELDKIMKYAFLQGYVYNPGDLAQALQENFIKMFRYGYSTWDIYYDKDIRGLVKYDPNIHGEDAPTVTVNREKYVFQDMPIAKSMFGEQLMDVEAFWKEVPKLDDNGNPIKDEKGNYVHEEIKHLIDARRIEKNGYQMYKQMLLGYMGAQIYSHRFLGSPYEHWNLHHLENFLEAVEAVPGGILYDQTDLKNTIITKKFFSHHDIEYLRSMAGVTDAQLLKTEGSMALLRGAFKGGGKIWSAFFKALR